MFTNEFIAAVASNTSLEPPDGFDSPNRYLIRDTSLVTLPPFHVSHHMVCRLLCMNAPTNSLYFTAHFQMAGLAFTLFVPIFHDNVPIYPLPGPPPTLQSLVEAVGNTDVNWVLVAPVMLHSMAQDPQALAVLSEKVEKLIYIGGSPSKHAGDVVRAHVPLYQVFGLSESGSLPLVYRDSLSRVTDWRAVEFHPLSRAQLRHRFGNLHELVLVNKSLHGRSEPVFALFPDLEEYETGDFFSPHPEKPNSWVYESRADDILVYSTGEKTNPVTFENSVCGHALVRGAVMIGEGRFESSLLVELADSKELSDEQSVLAAIDSIWPAVEEANSAYPGYARVSRSKILLTEPSVPMARTGKGTVQRRATIALYQEAIDDLYSRNKLVSGFVFPSGFDAGSAESVAEVLEAVVKHSTGWNHVSHDADFFTLGMDSLIVARLSQELQRHSRLTWIEPKAIYENPSVRLLTRSIVEYIHMSPPINGTSGNVAAQSRLEQMSRIYEEQTEALSHLCKDVVDLRETRKATPRSRTHVVLLTGSTGGVGSFLLDKLLQDDSISHVYCLNRSQDSRAVQVRRNRERGLGVDFPPPRVTFLTGQLGKTDLGLPASVLRLLQSHVTTIVHNAWPVDFNLSLISFQPSLDGLVNLLSLAAHSASRPSVLFLSSISATSNYAPAASPGSDTTVPETIISDLASPAATGYGESKFLGELILEYASKNLGLETAVIRVTQAAGSADLRRGWNRHEWFPTLVLTSKQIGALPETLGYADHQHPAGLLGDMDWIPIDLLSSFLVDSFKVLATREIGGGEPLVLHAANPRSTTWTALLPTVKTILSHPSSDSRLDEIQVVPYTEWVALLRARSAAPGEQMNGSPSGTKAEVPGLKLLDFYASLAHRGGSMARLSTEMTEKLIPRLRTCEPLRPEWMVGWIRDWLS